MTHNLLHVISNIIFNC